MSNPIDTIEQAIAAAYSSARDHVAAKGEDPDDWDYQLDPGAPLDVVRVIATKRGCVVRHPGGALDLGVVTEPIVPHHGFDPPAPRARWWHRWTR